MQTIQRITPCLWFDNQAEEAARFYTGVFRNSKIGTIARYGDFCIHADDQKQHGFDFERMSIWFWPA